MATHIGWGRPGQIIWELQKMHREALQRLGDVWGDAALCKAAPRPPTAFPLSQPDSDATLLLKVSWLGRRGRGRGHTFLKWKILTMGFYDSLLKVLQNFYHGTYVIICNLLLLWNTAECPGP